MQIELAKNLDPSMNELWKNRFKQTYRLLHWEIYSYLCSVVGGIKSKLFFNGNSVNRLELGATSIRKKEGFITSDISLKSDFPYDLRLGLPFPDNTLDLIYAEHVMEHFEINDLIVLLKECYRTLRPNGVISVVVPDAEIYIEGYVHPEKFTIGTYCLYDFGLSYRSRIDYVNYIFYMGGHHRYMFDKENLVDILEQNGFGNVRLRDFDPALDQAARRHESIYAEATKRIP